jgi:hypothetical protein
MGEVINFEEHQNHIIVPDYVTGQRHVVPVSLIREWAYGRGMLPSDPALLRAILWDWLCSYEDEPTDPPPPAA